MNRLQLYSPLQKASSQQFPTPPFVHAMVGTCAKEDGHTLLSAQLMTDGEIDEFVTQMKSELDEFAVVAKKELRKLKQRN
jgi:hypothetical protein